MDRWLPRGTEDRKGITKTVARSGHSARVEQDGRHALERTRSTHTPKSDRHQKTTVLQSHRRIVVPGYNTDFEGSSFLPSYDTGIPFLTLYSQYDSSYELFASQ